MHDESPAELYVPAPHAVQLDAPAALEYVPAGQSLADVDPASAYLPAGADAHATAPLDAAAPLLSEANVPATHVVQLDAPAALEYVPEGHAA